MSFVKVRRFNKDVTNAIGIRGYLHAPEKASRDGLVLTHGAGQNCESPLLVELATSLCEAGLTVLRCDLPFRQVRPQGPPTWHGCAECDREGLRQAVGALRTIVRGRVFLGGHSYGGRQSSMLAASEPGLVEALLLLSYPLHVPKRPTKLRTAHFLWLRTPALFVHGTRDRFGTIDQMREALQAIPARTELLAVERAGHELMTRANRGKLPQEISRAFAAFQRTHADGK